MVHRHPILFTSEIYKLGVCTDCIAMTLPLDKASIQQLQTRMPYIKKNYVMYCSPERKVNKLEVKLNT